MISILLATRNGHKFIKKSIDSVLSQTFKDFELLIGLNGENEATKQILDNINDARIKIFDYGNDNGKAKTLNKLLSETKFDWLAIQDDDDIWKPEKLEEQVRFIKDYDVIGTFIDYIDENDMIFGSPNLSIEHDEIKNKSLAGDNNVANTSAIFKKECAKETNGWDITLDGLEDFDFWLKLLRKDKKFINIDKKLVLHRIHQNSNFNTKKFNITNIL